MALSLFRLATLAAFASLVTLVFASWTGDATWYTPNGGLGACGAPSQNSDYVVALSSAHYLGGKNCWRHIGVQYGNNYIDATVVDLCPGCGHHDIDLSPSAFSGLANQDVGRMQVNWWYI